MSANPKEIHPRRSTGIATWRYVTIDVASVCTGYTIDAINQKIDKGVWKEGRVWMRAADGRRLIDREGYEDWVRQGRPGDLE